MSSTVGVLLDEIPTAYRDDAADEVLARDEAFWRARAEQQLEATEYRLVYRNFFYNNKMQLPPPPRETWEIELGAPYRTTIDGHDLVVVDYTFHSVLVTGPEQPELAEKKLKKIGKVWREPFVLPVDPDLLFDRTGYSCVDEDAFPDHSVDEENVLNFYDQDCTADDALCHLTEFPAEADCIDALVDEIGAVETTMDFERLRWNAATADAYRVGVQTPGGAQAAPIAEGLLDNRVDYIYVPEDSCALEEQCVGGSGWRRVLRFTASMQNLGADDLFLGDVEDPASPIIEHNLVSFSECHGHYHFNHYGTFDYGEALGGKRAFCLESTKRYFNNEDTPLTHPYGCFFQGVAAGWGDDYIAGIDCQWVDITDIETDVSDPIDLTFTFNPDGFVCEGEPILDGNGDLTFEPTDFIGENGLPEDRIACDELPGSDADNVATMPVGVEGDGSFVTGPCARGQLGENRNCGFTEITDAVACAPGASVTVSCAAADPDAPQVVRLCESSWALDTGTACTTREALANATVTTTPTLLTFTCPAARDAVEVGGRYARYTAPLLDGGEDGAVTCTVVP